MEIENLYTNIATVYQKAFSGEPWFEVSKCEDPQDIKRCIGGFSSLPAGSTCEICEICLIKPAYEIPELVNKFKYISETRPTSWYFEGEERGITLAALAWSTDVDRLSSERYEDNETMKIWLSNLFGQSNFIWLDEIFANREIKPQGNLANFKSMCLGFFKKLGSSVIAFRTINEMLINATIRDFGDNVKVFKRQEEVSDRRDLVVINFNQP